MTNKLGIVDDEVKVEILRLLHEGYSCRRISAYLGIPKTTITDFVSQKTYRAFWDSIQKTPIAGGILDSPEKSRKKFKGSRFVFTSAQNNTFVFKEFVDALKMYCVERNAELIIGGFTYNKHGFLNFSKETDGLWYDPYIAAYMNNESTTISDNLVWAGEIDILPTAVNPLSGLEGYTKKASMIVPHAKLHLKSVPRMKGKDPTFLYTTGCCTKRNYTSRKASCKASFHHIYSALVVEIDDEGDWFIRQLVADQSGSFQDLEKIYTPTGSYNQRVEAITYGDLHAERADLEACAASFINPMHSMLAVLNPKYQFVHDTIDFNARNHHNIDNPYHRFKAWKEGKDTVEHSIEMAAQVLTTMVDNANEDCQVVVVESNHDQALGRWLKDTDYRKDPPNAVYYLFLQYNKYRAMDEERSFHLFEFAVRDKLDARESDKIVFLKEDDSFVICDPDGIENASHGHRGINGARGSTQQFRKLNTRINKGHSHTAEIVDGVYSAGTLSKMDMSYNLGGTTWSHSNIITYPNGKRTIVTIKNGKWRG